MAVYEELREDILSLQIAPGSAMDEMSLAERFGLSRTPIREALVMLSAERLVNFLPNRSAIVAPHTMENTPEYLDALILHARAVSRLAALERDAEALERIRERKRSYDEASRDPADIGAIIAADLAFHGAVAEAANNEFLARFYRLSLEYGRRMTRLHYYPGFGRGEAERTRDEHSALVEAIARRDGDRAETLATEHVRSLVEVVQRSLEPRNPSTSPLGLGLARLGGAGE